MAALVANVKSDGDKVSELALSYPAEAVTLLVSSLAKRLSFSARNSCPTSSAVQALVTAHKHRLAVVAKICGSEKLQPAEMAEDEVALDALPLPPFAAEICALARRHGGLEIQPLYELVQDGLLHLAVLGGALPRLLKRLREPDAGSASTRLATEIEDVENSPLAWAVQAHAAGLLAC